MTQLSPSSDMEHPEFVFRTAGTCPLCESATDFVARIRRAEPLPERWFPNWFRDCLKCENCGSLPRERALFEVARMWYPDWRRLSIHESSPARRGASRRFLTDCPGYVASQYDPTLEPGEVDAIRGYSSQNLERQTFDKCSFDLVITQDVFEHLFRPDLAIKEIARTLRAGGAHILTVPIVNQDKPSQRRAKLADGIVTHLAAEQYHGNPMSSKGSLVTIDWGYDIVDYLAHHSGLSVSLCYIDDLARGLRAAYNEVLVCRKAGSVPEI